MDTPGLARCKYCSFVSADPNKVTELGPRHQRSCQRYRAVGAVALPAPEPEGLAHESQTELKALQARHEASDRKRDAELEAIKSSLDALSAEVVVKSGGGCLVS